MELQETIDQLGGKGLRGALAYTGTSRINVMRSKNSIEFKVNGRRGYHTYISVKLELNDTYTLSLYSYRTHQVPVVHATQNDVYCDGLQGLFEQMYDAHIKRYNHGFISLATA